MQPTSFFDISVHIELGGFTEYLDLVAQSLEEHRKNFAARIDAEADGLSAADKEAFFERHSDRWHDLSVGFPARFFNSYVVALCSWTEAELNDLCTKHESAQPGALRLKEVAGKGITRSQLYLKRVVGVAFPDTATSWSTLKLLFDIRNQLVHAAGDAGTLPPPAIALLNAHGALARPAAGIEATEGFCRMAIDTARTFFADLEPSLPSHLTGW